MKKHSAIILLFISIVSFSFCLEIIDEIATAIREGNPKNISKHFIERIDMKVVEKEDVYSKQQAEMILKDFFTKHPVKSFEIIHKSAPKNGSQYVIGTLITSNGTFRTYFLSKTTGTVNLIQQFRIENSND